MGMESLDKDSGQKESDPEQEQQDLEEKEGVNISGYIKTIKNQSEDILDKLPDDFFEESGDDSEIWESEFDKLADHIRDGLPQSLGVNFSSEILSNPADLEDDLKHEPWFDMMATIRYTSGQAKNKRWLNDSQRDNMEDLTENIKSAVNTLLEQVDFADPDALAYGVKKFSGDMQDKLWHQIREKYRDGVSNSSLEQVIREAGDEDIGSEAWDILKSRDNVEPILLKRISDYADEGSKIESDSAKKLLSQLEQLESAEKGEKNDELKKMGKYKEDSRYKKMKSKLENRAEE